VLIGFDTFRQALGQQASECRLSDETMRSANKPSALYLIGAAVSEEAKYFVSGGRQRQEPCPGGRDFISTMAESPDGALRLTSNGLKKHKIQPTRALT
jgi:hypothetical protein